MTLKTNKSISLTGTSTIGDVQVAYLNATIDQEGNGANTVNQFRIRHSMTRTRKKFELTLPNFSNCFMTQRIL